MLIGATIVAILASTAVPILSTHSQLRRQEELVFFLHSYKRAIEQYRKDPVNGGVYPRSMSDLLPRPDPSRRRYLRSRYKDPMTGKDPVSEPDAFHLDRDKTGGISNVRTRSHESLFETTPYFRWFVDDKLELRFVPAEVAGAAPP